MKEQTKQSNLIHKCRCPICSQFMNREPPLSVSNPKPKQKLETNFGITVSNPFVFILLHLRADNNKNPINLQIPQICIFHQGQIYDMLFTNNTFIKGVKSKEDIKFKKHELFRFFKQHPQPGKECLLACFHQNDYLLLSDNDLLNAFYQGSSDPLWGKLSYIQNRVPADNYKYIKRIYTSELLEQSDITHLVVESLLGILDESTLTQKMTKEKYLDFLGVKISCLINMKHNIRIHHCEYCFIECRDGSFWFVDAMNLSFTNLNFYIKKKEERILREETIINQKLLITPKKEKILKTYENSKTVKKIEDEMNNIFELEVSKVGFFTTEVSKVEFQKSEIAFNQMHPKFRGNYQKILQSKRFSEIKDQILETDCRKPLYRASRNSIYEFYVPKVSKSEAKQTPQSISKYELPSLNSTLDRMTLKSKNKFFKNSRESSFKYLHKPVRSFSLRNKV